MRPFFGRFGGKSLSANFLTELIPSGFDTYVEPFCGAASVFFRKSLKHNTEILNDLDENIYKIFSLVKTTDINDSINRSISKDYFQSIKQSREPIHILEKSKSSMVGKGKDFGYLDAIKKKDRVIKTDFSKYKTRLENVIILNNDFSDVIMQYDNEKTFFFIDPPYESQKKNDYTNYVTPEQVYNAVKNIKGKFILTYNDSQKIRDLFKDYNIQNNQVRYSNKLDKAPRLVNELVITNYTTG